MMRIMLSELHAPLAALTRICQRVRPKCRQSNYSIYGDRNNSRPPDAPLTAYQQDNKQQHRRRRQQA